MNKDLLKVMATSIFGMMAQIAGEYIMFFICGVLTSLVFGIRLDANRIIDAAFAGTLFLPLGAVFATWLDIKKVLNTSFARKTTRLILAVTGVGIWIIVFFWYK